MIEIVHGLEEWHYFERAPEASGILFHKSRLASEDENAEKITDLAGHGYDQSTDA
jgi:hypothetical protein